ncbi:hypothetical protein HNQ93_004252 [Hymenobacter luteus]|uniref:Uncharacterized protein n=2 Tax=Hymenobacter TaxID=89966 RepID=A0A7W9WDQ3_9BACT|nr:hypothetical protein [Hymenobacter latericoloratus]MBB6061373.1 hypothetical protein [Hymenobacter luteus]
MHALLLEAGDQRDQVFERASQPVELPHHERIAGAQAGEQVLQSWALLAGRHFFLHHLGAAVGLQGIELQAYGWSGVLTRA